MSSTSLAQRFAALPEAKRKKIFSALSTKERAALEYAWDWWARPNQIEPDGEWRVWLLLSGRGAGKTRAGAEWVRKVVEGGRASRIALVAATAADGRDVVTDGDSGLLNVCPPWNRPIYEPSKRRLTWPSGAIATLYSAEEPDRLRGPQHDAAWCLVGETMVTMGDGTVRPIRDIDVGDMVATPRGPRRVVGSALTRRRAAVFRVSLNDGRALVATGDHPVFVVGIGFVPVNQLQEGMRSCVIGAFDGADAPGICGDAGTTRRASACTARSGAACTAKSLRATTFTTSTRTSLTTGSKTSCFSASRSIARCTRKLTSGRIEQGPLSLPTQRSAKLATSENVSGCSPASGAGRSIEAVPSIRRATARQNVSTSRGRVDSRVNNAAAHDAASGSPQRSAFSSIARSGAARKHARIEAHLASRRNWRAPSSATHSEAYGRTRGSVRVHADCPSTATIVSVERLNEPRDVFDIAVDDTRAFFANGVLVHNCDEVAAWRYPEAWDQLMFGLRLGDDPRVVATTTPRPTPLIKSLVAAGTTHVTRGSTYENRAHLAPAFLKEIERRYANTRIGRQEIFGEILDDNPGAIFHASDIQKARVREAPPLVRVVVGVDPALSTNEHSDLTGLVVVGLGTDGHAYVLADVSGKYTPAEWARRTIAAYHEHRADRVVVEKNAGGDLVVSNLRTCDPWVPIKTVHASRGKAIRAEPVAALYEQGRVHHVGVFAALEDEMVSWDPALSAKSPDRMDALVWATWELMLEPQWVRREIENLPPG